MKTLDLTTIRKQTLVRAPRSRVWQALTNAAQFAQWFGVAIEGSFTPGSRVRMTSHVEGCEGEVFFVHIERMDAERLFSWRWHPGMVKPEIDYSKEPMTEVVFELQETEEGTLVTVTESGFDAISLDRRAAVYQENTGGWEYQMNELAQYVGQNRA
jgi:uncharacterized protein YndB with AHSA1/START domain